MSGFQSNNLDRQFLVEELRRRITGSVDLKKFEYVESRLRKAQDIYDKGGHVQVEYSDKCFSIEYDNKRRIVNA
jgi:hypothetical protein